MPARRVFEYSFHLWFYRRPAARGAPPHEKYGASLPQHCSPMYACALCAVQYSSIRRIISSGPRALRHRITQTGASTQTLENWRRKARVLRQSDSGPFSCFLGSRLPKGVQHSTHACTHAQPCVPSPQIHVMKLAATHGNSCIFRFDCRLRPQPRVGELYWASCSIFAAAMPASGHLSSLPGALRRCTAPWNDNRTPVL